MRPAGSLAAESALSRSRRARSHDPLAWVENKLGTFAYSYVGQSNRIDSIEYPNGQSVEYGYEGPTSEHVLKSIENLSSQSGVLSRFDYTYNQDRSLRTWKQTTPGSQTATATWSYTYDEALQLIGAEQKDPSNNLLEAEHYGYDQAQNRIQVTTGTTSSPATRSYKVNNLNQLVAERGFGPTTFSGTLDEKATVTVNGAPARVSSTNGSAPYTFEATVDLPQGTSEVTIVATDGNSNQTSQTYEVTTTGTTTLYAYDDTGNLRYEQEPNETTRKEYQWDQENRLIKVIEGTTTTEMEYDGQTRRTRIRVLVSGVEQTDHHFVWCGSRICEKRDGTTVDKSFFDLGVEAGSNRYYYTKDHLGSVWEVVQDNGTTITSRSAYDPWGRVTSTGAGYEAEFGYTGHLEQEDGDLVLAQYRGYDPYLGRWLSRDPLGPVDGPNLYTYVGNEPIDLYDTRGLYRSKDRRVHKLAKQWKRCRPACDSVYCRPLDPLLDEGQGPDVEPKPRRKMPLGDDGQPVLGYFDEKDDKIYIQDELLDEYPATAIDTLAHETYHWADFHDNGVVDYPHPPGQSSDTHADRVGKVCGFAACRDSDGPLPPSDIPSGRGGN